MCKITITLVHNLHKNMKSRLQKREDKENRGKKEETLQKHWYFKLLDFYLSTTSSHLTKIIVSSIYLLDGLTPSLLLHSNYGWQSHPGLSSF